MGYETEEEILKLGVPDEEFAAFMKANPAPPVDYNSLESFAAMAERRNVLRMQTLGEVPPTIKRSEISFTTNDGTLIRALLFTPSTPQPAGSPFVAMYHGGGWCIGQPENEEQTCWNLVHAFGAVCISIGYRLAPRWKFPYAVNDAWEGLQWAAKNATSWGADPSVGFVIGGTSAGANLTAILTIKAREQGLSPPLTGQYLAIPAVCPLEKLPEKYRKYSFSYEQNKNAPVLPLDAINMFKRGYQPDEDDFENWAPLLHPNGHKGLPRTLFQLAGMDPLRDEGLIYERILREENNVDTKLYVYPGLPHGHWSFFPMLKSSDKFRQEQVEGIAWLLGMKPDFSKVLVDAKPTVA